MASLAIGIVYELHDAYPRRSGQPEDAHVEYEPIETLVAIERAITQAGHRPVRLGRPHDLLAAAAKGAVGVDAALSIAEGCGTRNREAWAPVLLEMLGIPRLGSDALTLSLSLDKDWTRNVVAAHGVAIAPGASLASADEARAWTPPDGFPCFVKPRWEGTAKGIDATSRAGDRAALVEAVARIVRDYDQPALVESFLPGPEYTVTVVGNDPPRALPALQRALDAATRIGLHAVERPGEMLAHVTPGVLDAPLEATLTAAALRAYEALRCLDFARVDFKCDAAGRPCFLEINTLPTFAPDGSFGILAELAGRPYAELVGDVFAQGLARLGLVP
jgi:D-alanine-D-alanine ligase